MQRLRLAGLGGIDGGVEPVRAALLLKIRNLVVEHLDVAQPAAQAFAASSGVSGNNDTVTTVDSNDYPMSGQTPYGTYQNGHKDGSGMR